MDVKPGAQAAPVGGQIGAQVGIPGRQPGRQVDGKEGHSLLDSANGRLEDRAKAISVVALKTKKVKSFFS